MKNEFNQFESPIWMKNKRVFRDTTTDTLFAIVSHFKINGEIPTGARLASYAWLKVSTKAATGRLRRMKEYEFLIQDENGNWILHPYLIHKRDTAKLFYMIFQEFSRSKNMRCNLKQILEMAVDENIENAEGLIEKAHVAGYIKINKTEEENYIVVRDPIRCLIKYLKELKNRPVEEK